eukprot:3590690-Amphidinium_carterae.2
MLYKSWCPICVKAKGQPNHHRHGRLKEQVLIQLDCASTRSESFQCAYTQEVASSHNPDVCGNIDWSVHGNADIEKGANKLPIDTIEEVRHGERLWTIDHSGGQ